MMRRALTIGALLLVLVLLASLVPASGAPVAAQTGGAYDLSWWSVDGGGGESTGGQYALAGAVGQPDAGTLQGETYDLAGGFFGGWTDAPTSAPTHDVFLPAVLRE